MRGDQLARQSRVIRATKASSKGLTATEIVGPDKAQGSGQNEEALESLFQKLGWAFLLWGAKPNRFFKTLFGRAVLISEEHKVKVFNYPQISMNLQETLNPGRYRYARLHLPYSLTDRF